MVNKVYCRIYDWCGFNEHLENIYSTREKAIESIEIEARELGYESIIEFIELNDISIVEWEVDTNRHKTIYSTEEINI